MPHPELSRLIRLDQADGAEWVVEANVLECAAVATRLQVSKIAALRCRFNLRRESHRIVVANLHLEARVTQICGVTLDPFELTIDEQARVRFVGDDRNGPDMLDIEGDDEILFNGDAIDLGDAAVEQLALALPDYPRKDDADFQDVEVGDSTHPFARLVQLKRVQ